MTYTFKLSRRMAMGFFCGICGVALFGLSCLLASGTIPLPTTEKITALLRSGPSLFFIVVVGCAAGRIFAFQGGFEGSGVFLKQMFPGRTRLFYRRADFLLCCTLGPILGMIVVEPSSPQIALATGLGWPFIIRRLVEDTKGIPMRLGSHRKGAPTVTSRRNPK